MRKFIYTFIISILLPMSLSAQIMGNDLRQVYTQAENAYTIGRLEEAVDLLQKSINDFDGNLKQNALRLLSICHLALDNQHESEQYAKMLLNINPYYTSVKDPIRFEDMIARLKSGRVVMVKTASSQMETAQEAPVPVTIITREMIDRLSNNKSLEQILSAYVPGMTEISSYAFSNIAMRGVYTSAQEKILIMENGHRLNARSTNNGKIDYAISTEKIDHIEVLRGPASSLYGNVALTAVVNIITKSGKEIDGIKGKYGYGSYGTHKADFLAGTSMLGFDVVAWASIFTSKGEKIDIPKGTGYSQTQHDGYAYIRRYEGKPSYDIGCNIQLKDYNLLINRKYGKQVPQFSWFGETYDYDNYRDFYGKTPGYSVDETHLELGYKHQFNSINIDMSVYGDWYTLNDYSVNSDSIVNVELTEKLTPVFDENGNMKMKLYKGSYQGNNSEEFTLGFTAKADISYRLGSMKGNVLFGTQYEFFKLASNDSWVGTDYNRIPIVVPDANNILNVGNEKSISFFLQDKHYLTSDLILNVGLRYDNKIRTDDKTVSALSPRAALVYFPSKAFSAKLSYSRAFVDAPYFFRQNTSNPYRGSQNLQPEYMNSVQLDFLGTFEKLNLSYDVNLFYNNLIDIIVNNPSIVISTDPKYINAGKLKVLGVEAGLNYQLPSFHAHANMTWQYAQDAEQYYYTNHEIYSVPSFILNLAADKRLLNLTSHKLWLSGNMRFVSKTLNKANSRIPGSEDFYLNSRAIVDLGLRYDYNNTMQFSLDCDNVFNTIYEIGGSFYVPYRNPSRTLMGTVSFKL